MGMFDDFWSWFQDTYGGSEPGSTPTEPTDKLPLDITPSGVPVKQDSWYETKADGSVWFVKAWVDKTGTWVSTVDTYEVSGIKPDRTYTGSVPRTLLPAQDWSLPAIGKTSRTPEQDQLSTLMGSVPPDLLAPPQGTDPWAIPEAAVKKALGGFQEASYDPAAYLKSQDAQTQATAYDELQSSKTIEAISQLVEGKQATLEELTAKHLLGVMQEVNPESIEQRLTPEQVQAQGEEIASKTRASYTSDLEAMIADAKADAQEQGEENIRQELAKYPDATEEEIADLRARVAANVAKAQQEREAALRAGAETNLKDYQTRIDKAVQETLESLPGPGLQLTEAGREWWAGLSQEDKQEVVRVAVQRAQGDVIASLTENDIYAVRDFLVEEWMRPQLAEELDAIKREERIQYLETVIADPRWSPAPGDPDAYLRSVFSTDTALNVFGKPQKAYPSILGKLAKPFAIGAEKVGAFKAFKGAEKLGELIKRIPGSTDIGGGITAEMAGEALSRVGDLTVTDIMIKPADYTSAAAAVYAKNVLNVGEHNPGLDRLSTQEVWRAGMQGAAGSLLFSSDISKKVADAVALGTSVEKVIDTYRNPLLDMALTIPLDPWNFVPGLEILDKVGIGLKGIRPTVATLDDALVRSFSPKSVLPEQVFLDSAKAAKAVNPAVSPEVWWQDAARKIWEAPAVAGETAGKVLSWPFQRAIGSVAQEVKWDITSGIAPLLGETPVENLPRLIFAMKAGPEVLDDIVRGFNVPALEGIKFSETALGKRLLWVGEHLDEKHFDFSTLPFQGTQEEWSLLTPAEQALSIAPDEVIHFADRQVQRLLKDVGKIVDTELGLDTSWAYHLEKIVRVWTRLTGLAILENPVYVKWNVTNNFITMGVDNALFSFGGQAPKEILALIPSAAAYGGGDLRFIEEAIKTAANRKTWNADVLQRLAWVLDHKGEALKKGVVYAPGITGFRRLSAYFESVSNDLIINTMTRRFDRPIMDRVSTYLLERLPQGLSLLPEEMQKLGRAIRDLKPGSGERLRKIVNGEIAPGVSVEDVLSPAEYGLHTQRIDELTSLVADVATPEEFASKLQSAQRSALQRINRQLTSSGAAPLTDEAAAFYSDVLARSIASGQDPKTTTDLLVTTFLEQAAYQTTEAQALTQAIHQLGRGDASAFSTAWVNAQAASGRYRQLTSNLRPTTPEQRTLRFQATQHRNPKVRQAAQEYLDNLEELSFQLRPVGFRSQDVTDLFVSAQAYEQGMEDLLNRYARNGASAAETSAAIRQLTARMSADKANLIRRVLPSFTPNFSPVAGHYDLLVDGLRSHLYAGSIGREVAENPAMFDIFRDGATRMKARPELAEWVEDVIKGQDMGRLMITRLAQSSRDFILHDYSRTWNFDILLQMVMPWEIWPTRTAVKWAYRTAERPWLLSQTLRAKENLPYLGEYLTSMVMDRDMSPNYEVVKKRLEEDRANLPSYMRDFMRIPWPNAGGRFLGTFVNPINQQLMPVMNFFDPYTDRETEESIGKTLTYLKDVGPGLSPVVTTALAAKGFFGPSHQKMPFPITTNENFVRWLSALPGVRNVGNQVAHALGLPVEIPEHGTIAFSPVGLIRTFLPGSNYDPSYIKQFKREIDTVAGRTSNPTRAAIEAREQLSDFLAGKPTTSPVLKEAGDVVKTVMEWRKLGGAFSPVGPIYLEAKDEVTYFKLRDELYKTMKVVPEETFEQTQERQAAWFKEHTEYIPSSLTKLADAGKWEEVRDKIRYSETWDALHDNDEAYNRQAMQATSLAQLKAIRKEQSEGRKKVLANNGYTEETFYNQAYPKSQQEQIESDTKYWLTPAWVEDANRQWMDDARANLAKRSASLAAASTIRTYYEIPKYYTDKVTGLVDWKSAIWAQNEFIEAQGEVPPALFRELLRKTSPTPADAAAQAFQDAVISNFYSFLDQKVPFDEAIKRTTTLTTPTAMLDVARAASGGKFSDEALQEALTKLNLPALAPYLDTEQNAKIQGVIDGTLKQFTYNGNIIDTKEEALKVQKAIRDMAAYPSFKASREQARLAIETFRVVMESPQARFFGVRGQGSESFRTNANQLQQMWNDYNKMFNGWTKEMEIYMGKAGTEVAEAHARIQTDIPEGIPNAYAAHPDETQKTVTPKSDVPVEPDKPTLSAPATPAPGKTATPQVKLDGVSMPLRSDPVMADIVNALYSIPYSDPDKSAKEAAILAAGGVTKQDVAAYQKRNDTLLQMLETKFRELVVEPGDAAWGVVKSSDRKDLKESVLKSTITPDLLIAAVLGDPVYTERGATADLLWETFRQSVPGGALPDLKTWWSLNDPPAARALQTAIDNLYDQRSEIRAELAKIRAGLAAGSDAARAGRIAAGKATASDVVNEALDRLDAADRMYTKLIDQQEMQLKLARQTSKPTLYDGTPQALKDILLGNFPAEPTPEPVKPIFTSASSANAAAGQFASTGGGTGGGGAPRATGGAGGRETFDPDGSESPDIEFWKERLFMARSANQRLRIMRIIRALRSGRSIKDLLPSGGFPIPMRRYG